jgi:hypothetical protein
MALDTYPHGHEHADEIKQLFDYADDIEQKFSSGRAVDITPDWLNHIIQLSISLGGKTSDRTLKSHLTRIENSCYAGIVDYNDRPGRSEYFGELRTLIGLLKGLSVFI